jgi:hypothetical protein
MAEHELSGPSPAVVVASEAPACGTDRYGAGTVLQSRGNEVASTVGLDEDGDAFSSDYNRYR